jgi:hypothetical protein
MAVLTQAGVAVPVAGLILQVGITERTFVVSCVPGTLAG